MKCYCGTGIDFSLCCEPYLKKEKVPATPEALMRSRYTAHVLINIPYIKETLTPESRRSFNENDVKAWAQSEWLGLEILKTEGPTVEFIAKYKSKGKIFEHHEVSTFKKIGDRWLFSDGESHVHEEGQGHHHHYEPVAPIVRESPKIGRNDPCICGSGKKFKKCCAP